VPRHPERCAALAKQIAHIGLPYILRSELSAANNLADTVARQTLLRPRPSQQSGTHHELNPIVIVDVIGELGAWWGCASAAYVGGSLGKRGGQNMMEPAAFGIPVSFGPNTVNFKDIVQELLANDAARVITDKFELTQFVEQALKQPDWANALGQRAKNTVIQHQGASQRTSTLLCAELKKHFSTLANPSPQKPNQAA
jgi:3-deoxy-D-manno-octulosonic-acid transferase